MVNAVQAPEHSWLPHNVTSLREGALAALIIRKTAEKLTSITSVDVAIAGAGPAGLTAAWLLAEKGLRVVVVEHSLGVGGGMRGGSMLMPVGLVEDGLPAELLRRAGARLDRVADGLYAVDPTEAVVKLAAKAIDAGAVILPGLHVEDLILWRSGSGYRVAGLVINLSPVVEAGWHVDPIYIEARATIDATGHDAELVKLLSKALGDSSIRVRGTRGMDVWEGEKLVVEYTGEVYPGLYAAGMAVSETYQLPRMGPVFGGMLASGARVAELVASRLSEQ